MALQDGVVLLTGPVGNLSFYKMNGRYFVRRKSGVNAGRINSEPAYARTRENIAEFRRATLATKLFRGAFQPLFKNADNRVSSRLTGLMVKVIQGDVKNSRGARRVNDGNLSLLEKFEINKHSEFSSIFQVPFRTLIDRVEGTAVIDIPSLVPAELICAPNKATHYRLKAGAAAIDFAGNTCSATMSASADLRIHETKQSALQLNLTLPPASPHPLFVVLSIEFTQQINGVQYPLNEGQHNAITIAKADGCPCKETPNEHKLSAVIRFSRHKDLLIRATKPRLPARDFQPRLVGGALSIDQTSKFQYISRMAEHVDSS